MCDIDLGEGLTLVNDTTLFQPMPTQKPCDTSHFSVLYLETVQSVLPTSCTKHGLVPVSSKIHQTLSCEHSIYGLPVHVFMCTRVHVYLADVCQIHTCTQLIGTAAPTMRTDIKLSKL